MVVLCGMHLSRDDGLHVVNQDVEAARSHHRIGETQHRGWQRAPRTQGLGQAGRRWRPRSRYRPWLT